MPLENTSKQDNVSAQPLPELTSAWQNFFTSLYITTIQRQVSALGPALDDAYYILKKVSRPVAGGRPDPDLPSNIIHAITYSLDYWQRAIKFMCQQTNSAITGDATTTAAAIERATRSTTVSTPSSDGTAKPLALTVDLSRQLRQAL